MRPSILHEDDRIVAVDKPSGLLTLPDRYDASLPSLKGILTERFGTILTVHRIDRDTSGLVLFARHTEAQRHLSSLFEERSMEKTYLGIVTGSPSTDKGTIDKPIAEHPHIKGRMAVARKGKAAITHYDVLERLGRHALMRFRIETGRTHQIRVHLQDAGHPILCDALYGSAEPLRLSSIKRGYKPPRGEATERPLMDRLALHAYEISFTDIDGTTRHFQAPLHRDMEACLKQLRKWTTAR